LPSCLSIFNCILIVQWGLILAFHTCRYHTLISYPLYYLLFLYYYSTIQQPSVNFVMATSYTDAMHFNLIHSLSFSFPPCLPVVSSDRPTATIMFSFSLSHIYI
jgi:hypothetical protein